MGPRVEVVGVYNEPDTLEKVFLRSSGLDRARVTPRRSTLLENVSCSPPTLCRERGSRFTTMCPTRSRAAHGLVYPLARRRGSRLPSIGWSPSCHLGKSRCSLELRLTLDAQRRSELPHARVG
jgi:hypothetical protein